MSKTGIEWTDETWNQVTGCTPVSAGCANCWAKRQAMRRMAPEWRGDRPWTDVRCHPERLEIPLHWRRPRKIATGLMGDLFHPDEPDAFIDKVFAVMALCPQHTFQVLTKRPERMREYLTAFAVSVRVRDLARHMVIDGACGVMAARSVDTEFGPTANIWRWPLKNVWLGVSVEDQATADVRIPVLLQTPAAVRFVSAEPLLGPVNFTWIAEPNDARDGVIDALRGRNWIATLDANLSLRDVPQHQREYVGQQRTGLDLVIAGGESGPKARPCDVQWIRSIVEQCKAAQVPCFVKQLGVHPYDGSKQSCDASTCCVHDYTRLRLRSHKGADPSEWPADLRVREFPSCR